jgi:hypothetical protein
VAQLFHTQGKRPVVDVTINEKKIKLAGEFKYPRFTGTEDYP